MIFEDQKVYRTDKNKFFPEVFCINCQNGFHDTFQDIQDQLSNNFSVISLNDNYSIIFLINKKDNNFTFPDELFGSCSITSLFFTKDHVKTICHESTKLQPDLFYFSFAHFAEEEIAISKNEDYIFDHQQQIDNDQQTEFYGFREFKYLVLFFMNIITKFHIWPAGIIYSDINYFSEDCDEFHDELRILNDRDISIDGSFTIGAAPLSADLDDSDQDFYQLNIQETNKIEDHSEQKVIEFVPNHPIVREIKPLNIQHQPSSESLRIGNVAQHDWRPNTNFYEDFKERPNLVYCYFRENPETLISFSKQESGPIFGVTNAKDIQRSFYYPGTKEIFTFIGFSNMNQLIDAAMNSDLKNASRSKHVEVFDKSHENPSHEVVPIETTSEVENDSASSTESYEKKEEDSELSDETLDEENNNKLEYGNEFCPKENTYYLMILDSSQKVNDILKEVEDFTPNDIQKNIKFENCKPNYTFIGFETSDDRINAITNYFRHAVAIQNLVIDPKLHYIRFIECKPANCTADSIFASKEFYGLTNYSEIQRFAIRDKTVFTYVGFITHEDAVDAMKCLKESENDVVDCIQELT